MNTNTIFLTMLVAVVHVACVPCESTATDLGDTRVCIPTIDGGDEVGDSGLDGGGDEADPTGDGCEVPIDVWGPCDENGGCPSGFCVSSSLGSVCSPPCLDETCHIGCHGECRPNGVCAPTCMVNTDCPLDGMICDANMPSGATCVWPLG